MITWNAIRLVLAMLALVTGSCAPLVPGPEASPPLAYSATVSPIDEELAERMGPSWRPGCPTPLADLAHVELVHWGLDGIAHTGELVVNRDVADDIVTAFGMLYDAQFPIERMALVGQFGADDQRSMRANNTSAFNCRFVAGTARWSQHAFGRAIDINPLINPYLDAAGRVDPPEGAAYADRNPRPGLIIDGDPVVDAFESVGWEWGGHWNNSKDYQHFSRSGN